MAGIVGSHGPVAGGTSINWAALGAVAGQLAVLWETDGGRPDGWQTASGFGGVYTRRLTSDDISTPLVTSGRITAAVVLSEAGGVGRVRTSEYARLKAGGVGLWLGWMSPYHGGALASSTYQRGSTVTDPFDGYRHAVFARAVASGGDYSPGSVSHRADWLSVEVLPLAAPLAPAWITKAGATDVTQATRLAVAHRSSAESAMDRLKVLIRPAGSSTWAQHVSAIGVITAGTGAEAELVNAAGWVDLVGGQLAANTTYEVVAYTRDAGGWSPASPTLTLVGRTPPTAVVTLTTAHGSLTPSMSWVTTPGLGVQRSWEARVSPLGAGPDGAIAAWQSGPQAGTGTSWVAPASADRVVNGGSYVGWVRVTDDALPSAWTASTPEVVSWTPPAAPASLVAADGTPPSVTAFGVPSGSVALEWDVDGDWLPSTVMESPASAEVLHVALAPYGVEHVYRARAWAVVSGVRLPSDWVDSNPLTSTDHCSYLVDGTDWLRIRVRSEDTRTPIESIATHVGLDARSVRTDRTPRAGWDGGMVLSVSTLADHDALVDWLDERRAYVYRPAAERDDGGPIMHALPNIPISRSAVYPVDRLTQTNSAHRLIGVRWVTQHSPQDTDRLGRAIRALGPAGWWRLDETAGVQAADSSGNGRHGTYTGTVALAGRDGAVRLDGGGRIVIPDADVWSPALGPITVWGLAYVDPATPQGPMFMASKSTPDNAHFEWAAGVGWPSHNTAPSAVLWAPNGDNRQMEYLPSLPWPTGRWTALCATLGQSLDLGARFPLYLDSGDPLATSQSEIAGGVPTAGTGPLSLGGRSDGVGHVKGAMRDWVIFPRALTSREVARLMAAARADGLL